MRSIDVGTAVRLALFPLAFGLSAASIPPAHAGSLTLNFDASCPNPSISGGGGNVSVSCGPTDTTSAPACAPYTPTPRPAPGASVTLYASCTQNPTAYTWTGGGLSGVGATVTVAPTAQTTYTVTATNSAGTSAPASVTVSPSTSPPPIDNGGGIPSTCNGFRVINMGALTFDGQRYDTNGFDGKSMAIATLSIPGGLSASTQTLSVFEFASAMTWEQVWVSKTACEAPPSTRSPYYSYGPGATMSWSIGGGDSTVMRFTPGETWYIHILNQNPFGKTTCSSGSCDIAIKVYKPI